MNTLVLIAAVTATPSPNSLRSSLNILIDNDLQGMSSPHSVPQELMMYPGIASASSTSSVILLSKGSLSDAASRCQALGEQLWSPELNTASIRRNLDYLKYQNGLDDALALWIAPLAETSRTIDTSGHISSAHPDKRLAALCTQTAPFSNDTYQDTSERWRVTVRANNEELTGCAMV